MMVGDAGDDSLTGSQQKIVFGGVGSDVYVFLTGGGNDLIVEDAMDRTTIDIVQLRELASTGAYALSPMWAMICT